MEYKEFTITDNGYALAKDNSPVEDISGLSNTGAEKFYHLGSSGIPDTAEATIHFIADMNTSMFICYEGTIPDGVDIPQTEVLTKLVDEYGLPASTTLDETGKPIVLTEA